MGILDRGRVWLAEAIGGSPSQAIALRQLANNNELLQEGLADLELAIEDAGWQRYGAGGGESMHEFSREALRRVALTCRLYWIKNPLIKRAVELGQAYTFGEGVTISAVTPEVNAVIQAFLDDPKNMAELTSHQALEEKEAELQIEANLFFVFVTDLATGAVRVRTVPFREIIDKISNPDDRRDPWFYLREWTPINPDGTPGNTRRSLFPDWNHMPGERPDELGGVPIAWNMPMMHMATNKIGDMKFGIPELYAAIDWAKAYNGFLSDWATIVSSYARFAWKGTSKGGAQGVAALKAKFNTSLDRNNLIDRNPSPAAGSAFMSTPGETMEPIKTAGATTSADDGRNLKLMVCAATGWPEHYFGDGSQGNMATATTMERPVELKILKRRKLWADTFAPIFQLVIRAAVAAGKLPGVMDVDGYGVARPVLGLGADGEPMAATVNVDFPALLEHSVTERIAALVSTATLGGSPLAGTLDLPTFTRMALTELGADNIDELIDKLFPEGWEADRAQAAAAANPAFKQTPEAQAAAADVAEALAGLREAIATAHENLAAA